ncbi:MAG: FCD domain-containing protein, partial [Deltaproteobacteria bacterium]|nr:FCD domain-containing protein [Deltaproteobacteria bacterium]
LEAQEAEFLAVTTATARINQLQRVHHIIAESCRNHFFEAISKSMMRLTYEIVEAVDPDHQALHMPGEHQEIIQAVIKGNTDEAKAAMQKHLEKFRDNLIKMEAAYRQKIAMTASG